MSETSQVKMERLWEDIWFYCVATIDGQNDFHVDIKVYRVVSFDEKDVPYFKRFGAASGMDMVGVHKDAQVYLEGRVKWDGCSDFRFTEHDRCALHFCEKESAQNLGVLMGRIYDMAKEMMPKADW